MQTNCILAQKRPDGELLRQIEHWRIKRIIDRPSGGPVQANPADNPKNNSTDLAMLQSQLRPAQAGLEFPEMVQVV